MSSAAVTALGEDDDTEVIDYVVAAQADPSRHVTYLGTDTTTVRAELSAVAQWRERTFVARAGDGVLHGVLTADVDPDLGRLWWLGPWAEGPDVARALLQAARGVVGGIAEREFAPDARHHWMGELALDLGYHPEVPSAVLVAELAGWAEDAELPAAAAEVRELEPEDTDDVVRLHDHLFAGTHTTGRSLVGDQETSVLVAGEPPRGYVATQVQADGSLYVDFVGVDPSARGRGLGRALVAAALVGAAAAGVARASLTVREDNRHARALYASLGFVKERRIAPYRRGFTRDEGP